MLLAVASTALGQEQGSNEDLIRASKVPPSVIQRAEKEAPGFKFSVIYRDSEKGYRLVGKKADGSSVSVRIGREGKLDRIRTWTELAAAKVPKVVANALQAEIRKPPVPRSGVDLTGFTTSRIWLVDEFVTQVGQGSTFYEFLGRTALNPRDAVQVSPAGEVVGVKQIQLSPSIVQRQSFPPANVAAVMKANLENLVPGIKLSRVVRMTVTPTYPNASGEDKTLRFWNLP